MNKGSKETKHMVVVAGDRDTAEMIRSRIEQRQEKSNDKAKAEVKTKQRPAANALHRGSEHRYC